MPLFDSLRAGQTVLVLSAHCDDAEIGCGGLLRRLVRETDGRCKVVQIVFTGGDDPQRRAEQENAARAFGIHELTLHSYPDTALPHHYLEIKNDLLCARERIGSQQIGLVICPRLDDLHQDHRTVCENAWRIFRDHLILEYEILKYEGQGRDSNFYVRLSEAQAHEKADLLLQSFPSRAGHLWWCREAFLSLMRVRGVEANAAWAEGFVARKMVV